MQTFASGQPSAESCCERGRILLTQHRYKDAADCFQQALQLDASHAASYTLLAVCWLHDDTKKTEAVDAARRGVALDAENAFAHSVLALALTGSAKDGQTAIVREALSVAKHAASLDPYSDFSFSTLARIHLRLRDYPAAEAAARKALEIDTENTSAAEVLSVSLLLQHKDEDNSSLVRYQLESNPEDDSSHVSAGWLAMSKGDHRKANQHFLEALRLNPLSEPARLGLVESYRTRSVVYRLYWKFGHFMNRFSEGRQMAIMIGGFVAYRMLSGALRDTAPLLSSLLVAAWLILALWSHLARGFSSFFMLMDGYARRSLKTMEKLEGLAVGGIVMLALVYLAYGLVVPLKGTGPAALALFLAAVVNAAAFTNDHYIGRKVYGVAAAIASMAALWVALGVVLQVTLPLQGLAFPTALWLGVAASWLRPLRVLWA